MNQSPVIVSGAFDDLRSRGIRFLQEAARLGPLTVLLHNDESIVRLNGAAPKFPEKERLYFIKALRFVTDVHVVKAESTDALTTVQDLMPITWVMRNDEVTPQRKAWCAANLVQLHPINEMLLNGFPAYPPALPSTRKKVIVTGCYDWFHSGHVRFFEEANMHGDLYVIVGHDENIRLLKGEGHPLLTDIERCYVAGAVRYVTQALVSTGNGWLDADPEIRRIKPDIYAVNEDGDKGGKREYCEKMGIQYLVLKRTPAPGLPKRSSTDLRGF